MQRATPAKGPSSQSPSKPTATNNTNTKRKSNTTKRKSQQQPQHQHVHTGQGCCDHHHHNPQHVLDHNPEFLYQRLEIATQVIAALKQREESLERLLRERTNTASQSKESATISTNTETHACSDRGMQTDSISAKKKVTHSVAQTDSAQLKNKWSQTDAMEETDKIASLETELQVLQTQHEALEMTNRENSQVILMMEEESSKTRSHLLALETTNQSLEAEKQNLVSKSEVLSLEYGTKLLGLQTELENLRCEKEALEEKVMGLQKQLRDMKEESQKPVSVLFSAPEEYMATQGQPEQQQSNDSKLPEQHYEMMRNYAEEMWQSTLRNVMEENQKKETALRKLEQELRTASGDLHKRLATNWVPDESVTVCQDPDCEKKFSFFTRKHHCRRCGNIFCSSHISHKMKLSLIDLKYDPLLGVEGKVCDDCFCALQDDGTASTSNMSLDLNATSGFGFGMGGAKDLDVAVAAEPEAHFLY